MRIIESKEGETRAFTVYPASEHADELLKDLVRYALANGLFFTVGAHETDPLRLIHLDQLSPAQAADFRHAWGTYLASRHGEIPAHEAWGNARTA